MIPEKDWAGASGPVLTPSRQEHSSAHVPVQGTSPGLSAPGKSRGGLVSTQAREAKASAEELFVDNGLHAVVEEQEAVEAYRSGTGAFLASPSTNDHYEGAPETRRPRFSWLRRFRRTLDRRQGAGQSVTSRSPRSPGRPAPQFEPRLVQLGFRPQHGSVPERECRTLVDVLRGFTLTPRSCYFCL